MSLNTTFEQDILLMGIMDYFHSLSIFPFKFEHERTTLLFFILRIVQRTPLVPWERALLRNTSAMIELLASINHGYVTVIPIVLEEKMKCRHFVKTSHAGRTSINARTTPASQDICTVMGSGIARMEATKLDAVSIFLYNVHPASCEL